MRLCKTCGHVEAGHVVHYPHVDPPAPYRGFCVIDPKCTCNLYIPAEGEMQPREQGATRVPAVAKRDRIAEMLAAAQAAVKPREKTARELLAEAAPEEGEL